MSELFILQWHCLIKRVPDWACQLSHSDNPSSRMIFHVSTLPPTETNINKHIPSLEKKKSEQIPQSGIVRHQSQRGHGTCGLNLNRFQELGDVAWKLMPGNPHLWPPFLRVDYCDWLGQARETEDLACRLVSFSFGLCVFLYPLSSVPCAFGFFITFLRSDSFSLAQLHTHKHQGSSVLPHVF